MKKIYLIVGLKLQQFAIYISIVISIALLLTGTILLIFNKTNKSGILAVILGTWYITTGYILKHSIKTYLKTKKGHKLYLIYGLTNFIFLIGTILIMINFRKKEDCSKEVVNNIKT